MAVIAVNNADKIAQKINYLRSPYISSNRGRQWKDHENPQAAIVRIVSVSQLNLSANPVGHRFDNGKPQT